MITDEEANFCPRPSVIVKVPPKTAFGPTPLSNGQKVPTNCSTGVFATESSHLDGNFSLGPIVASNDCDCTNSSQEETQQLATEWTKAKSVRKRTKRSHKANIPMICFVCGDGARSLHFGAMCCDSCKAFFRRSVQSSSHTSFSCSSQSNCNITKSRRKFCKYCRFQKCLKVGMKTTLVMPHSERIILWKSKLQKLSKKEDKSHSQSHTSTLNGLPTCSSNAHMHSINLTVSNHVSLDCGGTSHSQEYIHENPVEPLREEHVHSRCIPYEQAQRVPDPESSESSSFFEFINQPCSLSKADQNLILHLVELQKITFSTIPYGDDCSGDTTSSLANVFFVSCSRLHALLMRIEDLYRICKEDRKMLLKSGIAMSLYVHGAYMYDTKLKQFPDSICKPYLKIPNVLTLPTLRSFAVYPDAFHLLMSFYNSYSPIIKDEVIVVLLCVIALFNENPTLVDLSEIAEIRSKYIALLRNYLTAKLGERECMKLIPKFLHGFSILKGIVAHHDRLNVQTMPKTSDPLMCQPFLQTQMIALTALLERALTTGVPRYASVIKTNHSRESLRSKNSKAVMRKSESHSPGSYSLMTCSIFGRENRTDELVAFLWQNILSGDQDTLALKLSSMAK